MAKHAHAAQRAQRGAQRNNGQLAAAMAMASWRIASYSSPASQPASVASSGGNGWQPASGGSAFSRSSMAGWLCLQWLTKAYISCLLSTIFVNISMAVSVINKPGGYSLCG
jgi:hypothetical protein